MCKSSEISRFTPIKYNYINIHAAFNSHLLLIKEIIIVMGKYLHLAFITSVYHNKSCTLLLLTGFLMWQYESLSSWSCFLLNFPKFLVDRGSWFGKENFKK